MKTNRNGVTVLEPSDQAYNPPTQGGCWICNSGDGSTDDDMEFDMEFDTYYHPDCLDDAGFDSILDYEKNGLKEHEIVEVESDKEDE